MTLGEDKGVPREPFQEAFKRSGLSAQEVALRMGYVRDRRRHNNRTVGDASRLLRVLGLKHETNEGVTRVRQGPMKYEIAVRICRALDVDPVDLDI